MYLCLMPLALAPLLFLPLLFSRGSCRSMLLLCMLLGVLQLGIMYLISFEAYVYLSVSEFLMFTRDNAAPALP